ncbi:MAG: type ISP restriction/modification enzyme [Verrucomicrobiota bacterium]
MKNPDADAQTAALIWMHALAIGYSPAYLAENADGIRQDWPRIPLPDSQTALFASAELGGQVAALLDTENGVEGVTAGKLKPEFKEIAVLSSTKDLSLTAGWGHAGQNGVTRPGKGKLETRSCTTDELVSFSGDGALESGVALRLPPLSILGRSTHDVFLNESACWRNLPQAVWDYTIGGYQVIKKWLSYRESELLGRALTPDETREVTHMARRIAALILVQPELDKNYQAVKAATAVL